MELRYAPDIECYSHPTTDELGAGFLVPNLFQTGTIQLGYTDLDRAVIGGVVPTARTLALGTAGQLASTYFAERREIGVINIGGTGSITVDGKEFALARRDCLYIGRGSRQVEFASGSVQDPAWFYLISYPAHVAHPTRLATTAEAAAVVFGTQRDANQRTIRKYIHKDGIQSCQLVMGCTELQEGSIWNTMPPPWSIHCGAGTRQDCFIGAMSGENQEFTVMDQIAVEDLK